MIEINLLQQIGERQSGPKAPLGIDLSKIPIVPLVIAGIFYYLSGYGLDLYYNTFTDKITKENVKITEEDRKITAEIKATKDIRNLLDDIDKKKEALKIRTERVKEILNKRSNPIKALERIAIDMNNEVWLESVKIDRSDVEIMGKAFSYSGISSFLKQAQSSKYFQNSIGVTNEGNQTEKLQMPDGTNLTVEHFVIKGKILVFE